MSQRKAQKQPRRGPGKTPKPKASNEAELRPHKIVGQLVGACFNAKGEIIGEEVMGEVAIFRAQFAEVPKLIEEGLAAAKEQAEAEEAGLRHKAGR